jgi:AraC-like DNA-binding protein
LDWVQCLNRAIRYIEEHLADDISIDEVARRSYSSSSHFQLVFHLVCGVTVGEYIRNRRMSLAAADLLQPGSKVIDVATRYRYETPESFSKAFARFHGLPPSKARQGQVRQFHPLSISISIQGGFEMAGRLFDDFHWSDDEGQGGQEASPADRYRQVVNWAVKARGQNPGVFDALTEWVLDDSEWDEGKLAANEQILMQGVIARFMEQNARLRAMLLVLQPSGVVNETVFAALDRFDAELSGRPDDESLRDAVSRVFADFSAMQDHSVRQLIAGEKTGPAGVNHVEVFGYINCLKNSDAAVQWALFMPDMVKRQQDGFQIESFEYQRLPAMRFIGREVDELDSQGLGMRLDVMATLDAMSGCESGFDHDVLFMHHYGKAVDVEHCHRFWGRFMQAGAPVPDGFSHFDLAPLRDEAGMEAGPPFLSQCAYATFSGDMEAMHRCDGYDSDAMYDVTRNTMLGQGVGIPYPDKYWTAEVFLDGCDKHSTAYLFSAELG